MNDKTELRILGDYDPGILVVDDDQNICDMIVKVALKQAGYKNARSVQSGEACVEELEKDYSIKIVLLDIQLPGIDGIETLKQIKDKNSRVVVIIMTAFGSIERAVEAMKLGAFDFLTKPFNAERLRVTVGNCIRTIIRERFISGLAGNIFLSYAREDRGKVEDLYERLRCEGFRPWMDTKDILPGERWRLSIKKAIKQANFFLACVSNHSINKRGLTQTEVRMALEISSTMLDNDIYLIPVRMEACEMPEKLKRFQWIDYFGTGGLALLTNAILEGIKRRSQKDYTSYEADELVDHLVLTTKDELAIRNTHDLKAINKKKVSKSDKALLSWTERLEKEVLSNALRENNGNISDTAKNLGIHRISIYRKIKKYGLSIGSED